MAPSRRNGHGGEPRVGVAGCAASGAGAAEQADGGTSVRSVLAPDVKPGAVTALAQAVEHLQADLLIVDERTHGRLKVVEGQLSELAAQIGHLRAMVATHGHPHHDAVPDNLAALEASFCKHPDCREFARSPHRYCAPHEAEYLATLPPETPSARIATAVVPPERDPAATGAVLSRLADPGPSAPSGSVLAVGDRVLKRFARRDWWEGEVGKVLGDGTMVVVDFGRAGQLTLLARTLVVIPQEAE